MFGDQQELLSFEPFSFVRCVHVRLFALLALLALRTDRALQTSSRYAFTFTFLPDVLLFFVSL